MRLTMRRAAPQLAAMTLAGLASACGYGNGVKIVHKEVPTIVPVRNQCYGVVNGVRTTDYPSVALIGSIVDDQLISRCTGTWVSSNTILTAAHCVFDTVNGNMAVIQEDCAASRATVVHATTVYHLGVTRENFGALERASVDDTRIAGVGFGFDIAILTFPDGTAPATTPLIDRAVGAGDVVDLIGFGSIYSPDNPLDAIPLEYSQVAKRRGRNQLTADSVVYTEETGVIRIFHDRSTSSTAPAGTYSMVGHGDSGGPLMIGDKLAGVVSAGVVDDSKKPETDVGWFADLRSGAAYALLEGSMTQGDARYEGWEAYVASLPAALKRSDVPVFRGGGETLP